MSSESDDLTSDEDYSPTQVVTDDTETESTYHTEYTDQTETTDHSETPDLSEAAEPSENTDQSEGTTQDVVEVVDSSDETQSLLSTDENAGSNHEPVPEAETEAETEVEAEPGSETVSPEPETEGEAEPEPESKGCKRELESDSPSPDCKKKRVDSDDEDEGKLCPICLDVWSNFGDHRVCCLKCGHLFGHSCLKRWLNSLPHSKKVCPTCKRKVYRNDIRFIFVKKLVAVDMTEVVSLTRQLEESNAEKTRLNIELNTLRLQMDQKVSELKREIDRLRLRDVQPQNQAHNQQVELRYFMDKSMEINSGGGCRVLDYNPASNTIAVSLQSPNSVFTGYGIRKISVPDYRPTAFLPVHMKQIRDLAFKDNKLLSVSLDMKAKLLDMHNNAEVARFNCDKALWSCCWDASDSNMFYVGDGAGAVCLYDIRNPREMVTHLDVSGGTDASPVVSLASTDCLPGNSMFNGGLLCCKLNSCWVLRKTSQSLFNERNHLPLEGPFLSLRYNSQTKHILISSRPNQRYPYTRHMICELVQDVGSLTTNVIHTYQGAKIQTMLSRSCLIDIQKNLYTAAYHESEKNVTIWSVRSGQKVGSVPAHVSVTDLCSFTINNNSFLAALNEKKLDFFQINRVT